MADPAPPETGRYQPIGPPYRTRPGMLESKTIGTHTRGESEVISVHSHAFSLCIAFHLQTNIVAML